MPAPTMSRYTNREKYFRELAETSEAYYLDYIKLFKPIVAGCRVLEIGCGEGGNLLPFAKIGCDITGIDISQHKIEDANRFFSNIDVRKKFLCEDIFSNSLEYLGKFDIIIVHDVIEHIKPEYKNEFMSKIKLFLQPDGIVFMAFPSWQMPFGGHQQICKSKICSKVPFVHLLPASIYKSYLKLFREKSNLIEELLYIKDCKMTIKGFETLCANAGLKILDKTLWLINPHYKAKFNLRPTKLWRPLNKTKYLRNYLSTSCFYILSL